MRARQRCNDVKLYVAMVLSTINCVHYTNITKQITMQVKLLCLFYVVIVIFIEFTMSQQHNIKAIVFGRLLTESTVG